MTCFNIWDFDNTLYYNPQNDFSSRINTRSFSNFHIEFDNAINSLITGRHECQKNAVLNACKKNDYEFDSCSFLPFSVEIYNRNDFMDIYRQWKGDEILSYIVMLCDELTLSRSMIRIYDDDLLVLKQIAMRIYEEEGLDTSRIFIRHVQLQDYRGLTASIQKSIFRVK